MLSQDNRLNLLTEQNNRNGLTDWTKVATELGYGMNSIQCRRRWEKMSKQRIRDLTVTAMGDHRPEMVSHPVVVDSALLCIHAMTEPELKHIEDAFNSQKRERARNSSSTILSSNTTVTQMKRKAKRARRVDGYDDVVDDDDDYSIVDNGPMKKRMAKVARRYNDDDYSDDDEVEVVEEAQSGSNRASWTPELVRTCMMCSI